MLPWIGPVPTYAILYFAGLLAQSLLARREARRTGLPRRVERVTSLCYLLGMVVGAKALDDLRHGRFDALALLDPGHYLAGGLWGGLLVYLLLAAPLVPLLTSRRREALDLVAVTVPVPFMLAKVGCLLGGCCYGKPTGLPFAISFPDRGGPAPAGVPLHPTQVYEILAMAAVLAVLEILGRSRRPGTAILWLVGIYGLGRALTEVFRGDVEPVLGPLTHAQVACLAAGLLALAALPIVGIRSAPGRTGAESRA